jgi:hypothetical protein
MPIDPSMSITTPVTQLLGINHPILLAPMAYVTDAVSLLLWTLPGDLAF